MIAGRLNIEETNLPGVLVVRPTVYGDERGFFYEGFNARAFANAGLPANFVQDNFSRSSKGILRGLHYQVEQPQAKLVWVNSGEIFDVAVDLRKNSPTLGQWTGQILNSENRARLFVPEGFAHGFVVLSESADVCYKVTDYWSRSGERTLRWDDPDVAIEWPAGTAPILNARDAAAPLLRELNLDEIPGVS